ncbi:MAG: AAA family ATPase [Caldimonas sp.]
MPSSKSPLPSHVRIELVGLPRLIDASGKPVALERKTAALLALLALDGMRSRASLVALLWPDASPALGRNSLRQRLFRVQRAAGAELAVGHEELRLADGVDIDLDGADERLARDAHALAGELMDGLDYSDTGELAEWVDAARERWRRRRSERLAELASHHETAQQIVKALQYAQRLLADEPLLEHAHRRVMRLHYLRGDRSAALAAYERCAALMRDEFGAEPDRETSALLATVEAGRAGAETRALAPPVAVLRPPRLIGRAAPLAQLAEAVATRRVLLLHGEPGIGKSRLFEDFAEAHPALLRSGGQAGEARVPYATLARLAGLAAERSASPLPGWVRHELARLVPGLGPAPSARLEPLRLQQAFAMALAAWAADGITGIVVDDLHHADEASLESLLALAASPERPCAWLLGVRSQEMPALLQSWLAAADPLHVVSVRLDLLDADAVAALLASLALERFDPQAWSAPLARHSGGNPLFVLETVRALLALGDAAAPAGSARLPVPAALDALIERRLGQLPDAALRLARVAALAGADFDADVAAAVLDSHPLDMVEPWRELESRQLLREGRFSHDLIAETVLRALPVGIAKALHARLAAGLEALGRSPARTAPHWAAAESWSRSGEAYAAAARDARRASRRSDEVGLWEHAAEGFDRAGQAGKAFDARADSLECVILVKGIAAAAALVDRLDGAERTEPQRMRALTARANVCLMAGQASEGEAAARSAFDAATRLGAQWPRFEAARLLAVALAQSGRSKEALETIESFRDLVLAQGSAEQRHRFWADYAYALKAAQRAHDTADALRHAMQFAQEAGDHAELATLTSNLALVEGNLGRTEHALDHARRARALNDPLGVAVGPASGAIELYVSVHEGALGRYAESLAGFARARACFAANPGTLWTGLSANHTANVLNHLGQFARARQVLQWTDPATPATHARRVMLQSRIDRALGHRGGHSVAEALAQLDDRDPWLRMMVRLEATLTMSAEAGAAACAALRDEADGMEHLAIGMRARVLRAQRLAELDAPVLTGLGAPAIAEVDELVERLPGCRPADTYFGEAWWSASRAFDALGRGDAADEALRAGFEWVAGRALPEVPPEFRDSFLNRNPVNRDLLAAAARRLGLRVPAAPQSAAGEAAATGPAASTSITSR